METIMIPAIMQILNDAERQLSRLLGERIVIRCEKERSLDEVYIERVICEVFETTWEEIIGKDRYQKLVTARIIYAYLLRTLYNYPYEKIALNLKRHHASVMHYIKLFDGYQKYQDEYFNLYFEKVKSKIYAKDKN